MPPRALTPSEGREYERIEAENLADWKAGRFKDVAESKEALERATAHLGTPIPPTLIAKAVKEHGHLGLAALDVAADWTLARPMVPAPCRTTLGRTQPRSRRRRTSRRARAPCRRSADDGEPHHPDLAARHGGRLGALEERA